MCHTLPVFSVSVSTFLSPETGPGAVYTDVRKRTNVGGKMTETGVDRAVKLG